jgi:hypothetical protein
MKNNGEFKTIEGAMWQYNVHELSPGNCQSQANGLTLTPRTEWSLISEDTVSITAGSPVVTYTGPDRPQLEVGKGICPITNTNPDVAYCRTILSLNTAANTVTTNQNFDVSGSGLAWTIVQDPQLIWKDVSVQNNVFRDSATGISILGLDPSPGNATGAGVVANLKIRNNLFINEHMPLVAWVKVTVGPPFLIQGVSSYINGVTIENNTMYLAAGLPQQFQWLVAADDMGMGSFVHGFTARNNLAPGGDYGFFGSAVGQGSAVINSFFAPDAVVRNNATPGMNWACTGGRTCSGNLTGAFTPQWANAQTVQKLLPASPYAKKGVDGRDLGVDFDQLPLIKNLKVDASHNRAQVEFDVAAPVSKIACVLEVSPSRNLYSSLGDYTVVNDLNPAFFKQPDVMNRTNPLLPGIVKNGLHYQWPVGASGAVVGDDGVSHDLALNPGTQYYGRLQCGGDVKRFEFRTAAQAAATSSFAVKAEVPAGITGLEVAYGPTPALGTTVAAVPDSALKATVEIPINAGARIFYRLQYKDGSAVTYTGPLESKVF